MPADTLKSTCRRKFLKTTSLGGLGATTLGFPTLSRASTTVIKMQSSWDVDSIFQDMAKQYTQRVEAMSGGSLKIDLLPARSLVKAFQVQDACHKGLLDAAHTATAFWYVKNKSASLFGAGPVFGANAAQVLAWIHYGGGKELYRELVQDILQLNLIGFFCTPMPARPLGWFQQHVKQPEQMQGIRYRTVGLATEVMKTMGLEVIDLPEDEILSALERGVIEASDFNNLTSNSRSGVQGLTKHYHLGSYHRTAEFFEIIFNKDKFESLSNEHQAILEYSVEATSTANYGYAMDKYSADLWSLANEQDVNVYRTDQSIMAAQLDSWDKVLADLEKDPFFAKVVASQKEWLHRVSFFELMNAADYKLAYNHYFPGEINS